MNKKLICFFMAAMFLLPIVNCVQVSVRTSVGQYTERLGAGIDDSIYASSTITRDGLTNAAWATSAPKSKSSNTGNLNLAETHSVGSNTNAGAEVGVQIANAKSYSYGYQLCPGNDFVGAAEALDVTAAKSINAWAKAYNGALYDAGVRTQVSNGDLHGYSNCAIASSDSTGAYQMFDTATGTVQLDTTARKLSSKYTSTVEQKASPEASISTTATGTISNYEDAAVKTSTGTSLEQNAGVVGTFRSVSTAKTTSMTRTSDYGTKYDIDMQANIASSLPSVKGTLTYYMNPNLKVQQAVTVSKPGDTITLSAGKYDTSAPIKLDKQVTVRGQGITGSITNPGAITISNGGKNYVNSKEVFLRADDFFRLTPGWTWLTNVVNSDGISATYGVVPGTVQYFSDAQSLLQALDKSKFEIANHGLYHDNMVSYSYTDQYNLLNQATQLMIEYFYRPRTFIAPYGNANTDTMKALTALGYHTISANPIISGYTLNQLNGNPGFEWETNWDKPIPDHQTLTSFENAFNDFYNSNAQTYLVLLHPNTFYTEPSDGVFVSTAQNDADRTAVEQSIGYMNTKNVEFLTMEQYYKWGHS